MLPRFNLTSGIIIDERFPHAQRTVIAPVNPRPLIASYPAIRDDHGIFFVTQCRLSKGEGTGDG